MKHGPQIDIKSDQYHDTNADIFSDLPQNDFLVPLGCPKVPKNDRINLLNDAMRQSPPPLWFLADLGMGRWFLCGVLYARILFRTISGRSWQILSRFLADLGRFSAYFFYAGGGQDLQYLDQKSMQKSWKYMKNEARRLPKKHEKSLKMRFWKRAGFGGRSWRRGVCVFHDFWRHLVDFGTILGTP